MHTAVEADRCPASAADVDPPHARPLATDDSAADALRGTGAREADYRETSLATLVQMASAGRGVTLLPSIALPVENRRGQLIVRPFAPPAPGRTIGARLATGLGARGVTHTAGGVNPTGARLPRAPTVAAAEAAEAAGLCRSSVLATRVDSQVAPEAY
jgi:hypothetical protein